MATIFRASCCCFDFILPLSGIFRLLPCLLLMFAMGANAEHQDPASSPGGTKQVPSKPSEDSPTSATNEPEKPELAAQAGAEAGASPKQRTLLNLLGQTDSASGESRRNENVQLNLIDNNALKDLNLRLGATATILEGFEVDRGYFGTEYGNSPTPPLHARSLTGKGIHGSLFEMHNNSVFSARSFFQVGSVKPAHENNYNGTLSLPLWTGAFFSLDGSQDQIRGSVNGNILVPLPEERIPLTNDPQLRPIVERILGAYPTDLPNRTDIATRALNANSLQRINTNTAGAQLDQSVSDRDRLSFRYAFTSQSVDAFQLVVGQNPDTDTRSHSARITWNRVWSTATVTDLSAGFDRLGSLLVPGPGAIGPVAVGDAISGLGPFPIIPLDRAQNRFRYAAGVHHSRGHHSITAGFALTRLQYNGEETDGHRGILSFRNDFGRDAITNLRMGTPTELIQALGTTYRGFRNWETHYYLGDKWQLGSRLTFDIGLRYEPVTRPHDVTGRSHLRYASDFNNWAPSFGFAYRLAEHWGVLRAAYGLHYGQIFPVTYGQDRLNAPNSLRIVIPAPNLADPLGGVRFEELDPNGRTSLIEVSPNLITPYSHQYNLSWELEPVSQWRLQFGYVGSRSIKLIQTWFLNGGRVVEGIPFTSATINQRRPDQKLFEHLLIHNSSRGYYDAGRVSVIMPPWQGLTINASYWFSKSIDLGSNYTNTASGPDARVAVSQTEFESSVDLKALSDFDQPHAFLLQASYNTPRLAAGRKAWERVFGSWIFSWVLLAKQGTPFSVDSGSDGLGFGNVDGRFGDRPNVLDPSVLGRTIGHPDESERLLPASAFQFIKAPEQMAGNLGRNAFRRGRIGNVNASLSKSWHLLRGSRITFRAESINFFNTPQFAEPTKSLTSPSFGQISNTLNDGRTLRFQLRLDF